MVIILPFKIWVSIRKSKILENPIGRKLKTTNESIASILYKNDYFRVDIDVEISRAKLWQDLKMLILRSEASIIKLEIKGESTKIADHTFRQLSHIEFQFKQMDNQIGLMVQYGYFKACGKFFTTKAFKPTDIKAVAKILGVTVSVDFIEKYTDRTRQKHRLLILDVCGYIEFGSAIATLKKQWLTWLISKCTHTKD